MFHAGKKWGNFMANFLTFYGVKNANFDKKEAILPVKTSKNTLKPEILLWKGRFKIKKWV